MVMRLQTRCHQAQQRPTIPGLATPRNQLAHHVLVYAWPEVFYLDVRAADASNLVDRRPDSLQPLVAGTLKGIDYLWF